jgi:UDPglucose 6-dehydrogenase
MHITVAGTGYVGLVTGACLADLGNDVVCMDQDTAKIAALRNGRMPIHEPGLEEVVARNVAAGRLRFTTDAREAVAWGEVIFLCVGTPCAPDGSADLSAVRAAARTVALWGEGFKVVAIKSTCPVGTNEMVTALLQAERASPTLDFAVVSNPEFLREGSAVGDFMNPHRVIVGATDERARRLLARLYEPLVSDRHPLLLTDPKTAELIKYASNAFLAVKVSFVNEMADLCEAVGADVAMLARGMGLDARISPLFLEPGPGYGGSCFPKDVRALLRSASEVGVELRLPRAAEEVNARRVPRIVRRLRDALGGDLVGRRVALWGLAFKMNTNDMREAASLKLLAALQAAGAEVVGYDPIVTRDDLACFGADSMVLAETKELAAAGADALVILSGYADFRHADWRRLRHGMRSGVVFDARNLLDAGTMRAHGFVYLSVGRGRVGAITRRTIQRPEGARRRADRVPIPAAEALRPGLYAAPSARAGDVPSSAGMPPAPTPHLPGIEGTGPSGRSADFRRPGPHGPYFRERREPKGPEL